MPLKVSSQGWVKVAPPPKPRRRRVIDPEEQKEAIRGPLRYLACQGLDPSRERLRMLQGKEGFSSSEIDLLRPHSRLERSSTLDEWRWDTYPSQASRSSSRQSGNIHDGMSPPKEGLQRRPDGFDGSQRKQRASSAPVITTIAPPASIFSDQGDQAEEIVDVYPDNVSLAQTESPSERHCKHNHRHQKPRKAPSVIPEEDEPKESLKAFRYPIEDDLSSPISVPAPPPSIAPSYTFKSRKSEVEIPSTVPESEIAPDPKPTVQPATAQAEVSEPLRSSATSERSDSPSRRSKRSERTKRPARYEPSESSETSSRSSRSSRSTSTYSSRRSESVSSYTASVRSASPIHERECERERNRDRDGSHRHRYHNDKRYDDDNYTESSYPSPPTSPPPTSRKPYYKPSSNNNNPAPLRLSRDRVATDPTHSSRYREAATPRSDLSGSSWTSSSSSSYLSGSSTSSRSSAAPSINGHQFQSAIFQPKPSPRGYRAPSLSKGNRWETATSALSFD